MNNKQIVFTSPGVAELLPTEMPIPGENEVLVQIMVSTISSGTERANVSGEVNISVHYQRSTAVFPRYGGYSSAGIVREIGCNVSSVKPGDRVAISWSRHAYYVCVEETNVHLIESDAVSFEAAALGLIGAFPLAALRKCRLEIGESIVIMGLGVLGLIGVQLARAAGAYPVVAVDPIASKRERAMQIGADTALAPFSEDFALRIKEVTYGGAKTALEVTGNGQALNTLLDGMCPMGRVALLGCTRNSNFTVDYYHKVHGPGISLIGAHTLARPQFESSPSLWTHHDDILALLRLEAGKRIQLALLVEETHKPEEAPEIYRRLVEGSAFPVVQFDWRTEA
jgi:threonine dehydrogenase-like Zn-dependent dehydrogenase